MSEPAPVPADQEEALRDRYTVVYEGDPDGMKILSGEPAPGRAVTVIVGDQWEEVATLRAERDQIVSELREAREERDAALELSEQWKGTAEAEAEIGNERAAEAAKLRALISESATAIGNGACIGPECSLEFMAFLPREISGVTYDLRKRIGVLERFLDFVLKWRDRGPPHGDPETAWSVVSHHPVVRQHAEAKAALSDPRLSPAKGDDHA